MIPPRSKACRRTLCRFVLPLVLATAWAVGMGWSGPGPARAAETPQGPPPALVVLGRVVSQEVESQVTLTGTAAAHRLVVVASQVEGLVARGAVEEGQAVAEGQLLVKLRDERLNLQLQEAEADLTENRANLAQVERDLDRQRTLFSTKAVPLKTLEDIRTQAARLEAAASRLTARRDHLRVDLGDTQIRAPRAGVVVKRLAWRGEWVEKGGEICRLAVLDPIKAEVQVPERYVPHLAPGQAARVRADALPGREFPGEIAAVIPAGDLESRAFPVQVRVANPAAALLPGMLVRVTFRVGRPHAALLVPKDAVVIFENSHSVFTVADNVARQVPVKVIAAHGDLWEVEGALEAGQAVVVRGNERLRPGQGVKAVESLDSRTPADAPPPDKQP
ncbi:MAG: efflux RND transporter periplasmic adaptor subunit [Deltaproteobacteria bacterium]|nr:efflux RND transporter periplasmic adaptor subunit [Deltaproteobacteria bacterium]